MPPEVSSALALARAPGKLKSVTFKVSDWAEGLSNAEDCVMGPTGTVVFSSAAVPTGPVMEIPYRPACPVCASAIASNVYTPEFKGIAVPDAIGAWISVLPWNSATLGATLNATGN